MNIIQVSPITPPSNDGKLKEKVANATATPEHEIMDKYTNTIDRLMDDHGMTKLSAMTGTNSEQIKLMMAVFFSKKKK